MPTLPPLKEPCTKEEIQEWLRLSLIPSEEEIGIQNDFNKILDEQASKLIDAFNEFNQRFNEHIKGFKIYRKNKMWSLKVSIEHWDILKDN